MPKFQKGDRVQLAATNNGSKAFTVFAPGVPLDVEEVGATCSAKGCANPASGNVKIFGARYCAEAFELLGAKRPAVAGNSPMAGAGAVAGGVSMQQKSVSMVRRDPARDLYANGVDEWDTLPDVTFEEAKTLPTIDQLDAVIRAKHAAKRSKR